MPDTKITALTAITTVDPAVDVLPIVDVSDTTMAASGTTKKITSNQILGAGGTATLASATITGDLTVDTSTLKVDSTNNRVGIKTATPTAALQIASGNVRVDDGYQFEIGGSTNGISGSNASNNLSFYTNNTIAYSIGSAGGGTWYVSGSTAMTLNSTGLGVGASPSSILHAQKSQDAETTLIVNNTNTGTSAGARLDLQSNAANYLTIVSYGQNTSGSILGVNKAKLNVIFENALTANSSGLAIGTTTANPLYLSTNNTVRATIDASGNLLVGGTSSPLASRLSLFTTFAQPDGIVIRNTDATAGLYWRFGAVNNSNTLFVMNASSVGVTMADGASAWSAVSDERLKDIIEPISNAVSKIGSLRSVIGKYKSDADGMRRSFLIAQDVKSVLPEAVDSTDVESLGLRYTEVIPLLVAAIKELTARVEALEA